MAESYRIPRSVVSEELDREAVALNIANGLYYGLNETAAAVWKLVGIGNGLAQIVTELAKEFEVDKTTLTADVEKAIDQLCHCGLLEQYVESDASAPK